MSIRDRVNRSRRVKTAKAAPRPRKSRKPQPIELEEMFQVVIECADETQQEALYNRFTSEGLSCRLLVM